MDSVCTFWVVSVDTCSVSRVICSVLYRAVTLVYPSNNIYHVMLGRLTLCINLVKWYGIYTVPR
jgi:hypothetical protein